MYLSISFSSGARLERKFRCVGGRRAGYAGRPRSVDDFKQVVLAHVHCAVRGGVVPSDRLNNLFERQERGVGGVAFAIALRLATRAADSAPRLTKVSPRPDARRARPNPAALYVERHAPTPLARATEKKPATTRGCSGPHNPRLARPSRRRAPPTRARPGTPSARASRKTSARSSVRACAQAPSRRPV